MRWSKSIYKHTTTGARAIEADLEINLMRICVLESAGMKSRSKHLSSTLLFSVLPSFITLTPRHILLNFFLRFISFRQFDRPFYVFIASHRIGFGIVHASIVFDIHFIRFRYFLILIIIIMGMSLHAFFDLPYCRFAQRLIITISRIVYSFSVRRI